jgi:hypothetical protein
MQTSVGGYPTECRKQGERQRLKTRRKSGNVVVLDARYMQICYFFGAHSKGYLDTTQVHSNLFEKKKVGREKTPCTLVNWPEKKKEKKSLQQVYVDDQKQRRCPRKGEKKR